MRRFLFFCMGLVSLSILFFFFFSNKAKEPSFQKSDRRRPKVQDKIPFPLEKGDTLAPSLLGVPLQIEKQRKKEEGFLVLKVLGEGGEAATNEPVSFVHVDSLRKDQGWTDRKGEFRVFSKGVFVFQIGGRRYVRKLIPPLLVSEKRDKPPFLVKLKRGGTLQIRLTVIPGGTPFSGSKGLLFFGVSTFGRPSIHWRVHGPYSSDGFLEFLKQKLHASRNSSVSKGFGPKEWIGSVRSFMEWTGISDPRWVPYASKDFFQKDPNPSGLLIWEGLPALPVRWGLQDNKIPLQPSPPFERKEVRQKKKTDGTNMFLFKGRFPTDLSGPIQVNPGERKTFPAKVYTGNGVLVHIPLPPGWEFQRKPVLLYVDRQGDPHHGGAIVVWKGERKGVFQDGRYLFKNLRLHQEKQVFCWIRNRKGTKFQLLRSDPFRFEGGWVDLGSLKPLKGDDSQLELLLDGAEGLVKKELTSLFPITISVILDSFPMGKIKVRPNQSIVFLGARGKSVSFVGNPSGNLFPAHGEEKTKKWAFVKKRPNEILPDMGYLRHLPPEFFLHLKRVVNRNVYLSARVVEGTWPKGTDGEFECQVFPHLSGSLGVNLIIKGDSKNKTIRTTISEDSELLHKIVVAQLRFPKGKGKRPPRVFKGFTTQKGENLFIPLKPSYRIKVFGLGSTKTLFFLQPEKLFKLGLPIRYGMCSDLLKEKDGFKARIPLPLPGRYVLLKDSGDGQGLHLVNTFYLTPSNPEIDLR
ncbi:MAG TPA: hypothetical protein ENK02_04085 [Planctomycetes bacterium]|nr:hypothetical protein [Planctomycetota bacterium]